MSDENFRNEQTLPMCRADYLLSHLAQECAEVIVRITKAQMFGLNEIQPGQDYTNWERIMHEMADVIAIGEVMNDEGVLARSFSTIDDYITRKKEKAAQFSDYSRELGRLEPSPNGKRKGR